MKYTYRNHAGAERTIDAPMVNPPPETLWIREDGAWEDFGPNASKVTEETRPRVFHRVYEVPKVHVRWQHDSWGTAAAPAGNRGNGTVAGVKVR